MSMPPKRACTSPTKSATECSSRTSHPKPVERGPISRAADSARSRLRLVTATRASAAASASAIARPRPLVAPVTTIRMPFSTTASATVPRPGRALLVRHTQHVELLAHLVDHVIDGVIGTRARDVDRPLRQRVAQFVEHARDTQPTEERYVGMF